ncbi:hypothetical protein [Verrucomicrobium sp. BvORR106]|uniref:hypothetical protein n=1 Tax=Verrucomicrobium sp. BvORR106 TaxID=1403819 RepID=UPI000A5FC10D|nr:hypothetical protein [Verrucomicrobium sp. BvORR106]
MAFALAGVVSLPAASTDFQVIRLPEHGIQPRASSSTPEVVYLQGRPEAADVKLARLDAQGHWQREVLLNTPASQAVGTGTVRGPALAVGRDETRHVLWHGKSGTASTGKGSALYYSRVDRSDRASPPKDMMGSTTALDGGAAVVSDKSGNVWLVWHALPAGGEGETERRIFIRHSKDDGLSFSEPWEVAGEDLGACGCCGLAATAGGDGNIYMLYRSAEQRKGRGIRLLQLPPDATRNTKPRLLQQDHWELEGCPMTTADLLPSVDGVVPLWVNQFKLVSTLAQVPQAVTSKEAVLNHPRMGRDSQGRQLLIWTEGAMWGKGGRILAQWVPGDSTSPGPRWSQPLPTWSYGAVVTLPDGQLAIVY